MEQLVSVDNKLSAASVKPDMLESSAAGQLQADQCQKKSAQAFLGDNANLVNLDNLISFPSSSPSRELCAALCYKSAFSAISIARTCTDTSLLACLASCAFESRRMIIARLLYLGTHFPVSIAQLNIYSY